MKNLTDIKHRIKTVSDTRQITSAMETISVAKMRKAILRYDTNKAYFERIRTTISDIVLHTNAINSKYLNVKNEGERVLYIVIASDKGLAGGFNHNVLNAAWQKIREIQNCTVFAVGQIAHEFFERKNMAVGAEFAGAAYDPSMSDAIDIADKINEMYLSNMMDSVYIAYTKMVSSTLMTPDILKLLPLCRDEVIVERQLSAEEEYALREIEYEPSADEVLAELIPQYLSGIVYGALVQSVACEHSSRRTAMNNATNSANDILDRLNIEYNRARQEAVTNELSEIITAGLGIKA